MTFAQRPNRLTTRFSKRIHVLSDNICIRFWLCNELISHAGSHTASVWSYRIPKLQEGLPLMTVQSECIEDRWWRTTSDISKLGQYPGVHLVPQSLRTFFFAPYYKPLQNTSFWYVYSSLLHVSTIRGTCGDVDKWHHGWFDSCKSFFFF